MPRSELQGHTRENVPATAGPSVLAGRAAWAGPIVAAVALVAALVATGIAGLPLRDPGAVTVRRLATATAVAVGFVLLDIVVRAVLRDRSVPSLRTLAAVRRGRWTAARIGLVTLALACFHVTYLCYRNIKSVAPLLRPGDVFDRQLLDLDRWVFFGHDPYEALHSLLGTGTAAHGLAEVYMVFFAVIPIALAAGLVLLPDLRAGLFVAAALSLTWLLGAGSYLILPSIGPFHFDAQAFTALPHTAVTDLQVSLLEKRTAFLADPGASGAAQSIGAFASLHTAIWGTIVLLAHVLGLPRAAKALIWAGALLTIVATVYFGWHYLLDDVAGVVIALLAVGIAAALTGQRRVRVGETR